MASQTSHRPRLNRIGLIFLSLWVAVLVGSTLYGSWTEPQAQGQISLYQTDLTLEALQWEPPIDESESLTTQLFGENPTADALKQYQKVRQSLLEVHPNLLSSDAVQPQEDSAPVKDLQTRETLDQLDLKLGILSAQNAQLDDAMQLWDEVRAAPYTSKNHRQNIATAKALESVWRSQPVDATAEEDLGAGLSGWYRTQSLEKLYKDTANQSALDALQSTIQAQAQSAITRLGLAVGLPLVGSVAGVILLVVWLVKTLTAESDIATDDESSSATLTPLGIEVPWEFETFWLTMLLWFFAFFGVSLVIPLSVQLLFGAAVTASARGQALLALANYSGLIAAGLALIVYMTRSYIQNFFQWLPITIKGPWMKWGLGGYVVALPIVLVISLMNQKLLGDQGGGNPLLEIILQTHDIGTWFVLLIMVSVLAPLFEEVVFRGFALTSLTRYLPLQGAIAVSAVLFAIAHLNIADFLPLFVLGCILGTVYSQSKNLLSSILLHSLWNGAQLVELLYLSGN